MAIDTKLTAKQLMKLNPWIKTEKQARMKTAFIRGKFNMKTEEEAVTITCALCKAKVNFTEQKVVRIQRGWFDPEGVNDNIKYGISLCVTCFLNDPDLCAFFNKIGDNIR